MSNMNQETVFNVTPIKPSFALKPKNEKLAKE